MARSSTLLAALATVFLLALTAGSASARKPALSTSPSVATTAPQYFGFNDNAAASGQLSAGADAALAAQAGANVSRVGFEWRWAEPTQGTWNLATYDAIYQADLAKGIRPVIILMFAPNWAWADGTACVWKSNADCRYPPGPTHLDAWRAAVTKLVTRYPKMAALEIWNEPNLDSFWQGGMDPAYYTTLLAQAHDTVQALGSSVPVISAGLAPTTGATTSTAMNYRSFVQGMYAAGAKGKMDGLSLHPYPADIDLWQFFKMLTELRDIRDANGDSVPLWVTEIGVSTIGTQNSSYAFNENDQALMLKKLYGELAGMSDVRGIILHTLVDPTVFPATSTERGFGVMHVDLSPKPAFCTLASLRASGYLCPPSVAPVSDLPTQQLRWAAQDSVQAAADAARAWYRSHGTYYGLSPAQLHAINPSLSAAGADQTLLPGPSADPSRIGVWVWGTAGAEKLLLCNTSQANRSYCIETQPGSAWQYGSADGTVNQAAGATTNGASSSW